MKNLSLITTIVALTLGCASVASTNSQPTEPNSTITAKNPSLSKPDPVEVANKPKAATKSRTGSFISGEYATSGNAKIVQENGTYFIELDQTFKTSENGPDLFVILHRSPNILQISKPPDYGIVSGDYVAIAPLQSFKGTQRYRIANNIQPEEFKSVAIWCRKYNATFGVAPLSRS